MDRVLDHLLSWTLWRSERTASIVHFALRANSYLALVLALMGLRSLVRHLVYKKLVRANRLSAQAAGYSSSLRRT